MAMRGEEGESMKSELPIYHQALDWDKFYERFPVPDVFEKTVYKWSPERIRALQNERFLEAMRIGWKNLFYQRLWKNAGIQPGDIRSLDDITERLPEVVAVARSLPHDQFVLDGEVLSLRSDGRPEAFQVVASRTMSSVDMEASRHNSSSRIDL